MRINKGINTLIRINPLLFILCFLFASYLASYVVLLFPASASQNGTGLMPETVWQKIFLGVLVVPYFETLIFQTLIISIICTIVKRPRYSLYLSVLISAMAFSINHSYNIYYMLNTFIAGIILAFAYYIARYRKMNATITIFIIHSIWNSISFLTD